MKIKLKNTLYFFWDTLIILSKILKSNEVCFDQFKIFEIALHINWYLRYCLYPTDIELGIIERL